MKTLLTTAAFLAAGALLSNAATVLVSFGASSGVAKDTFTDNYMGVSSTYNLLKSASSGTPAWTNLTDSSGAATDIGISSSFGNAGNPGMVTSLAGTTTDLFGVFAQTAVTGNTSGSGHGGVLNADSGGLNLTFSNLAVGQKYSLTLLTGRGNAWGAVSNCVHSLTEGASGILASVITYNGTEPTVSAGTAITSSTLGSTNGNCTNWGLINFTFDATATSVKLNVQNGASINALALATVPVPEPSAFGLLAGLGALALVASRRRRSQKTA